MADTTSPSSVPATPKREVITVAAGEAIPTARILGKSIMFAFSGALSDIFTPPFLLATTLATRYEVVKASGCFYSLDCRQGVFPETPAAPVLVVYRSSTGAQRFLFASDGYDSYATHAAGPDLSLVLQFFFYFWSCGRPEIDHLSVLFRALPRSNRLSIPGLGPRLRGWWRRFFGFE